MNIEFILGMFMVAFASASFVGIIAYGFGWKLTIFVLGSASLFALLFTGGIELIKAGL